MKTLKLFFFCVLCAITAQANNYKSIRDFNVLPTNTPEVNKQNLQKAIDWERPYLSIHRRPPIP